MIRRKPSYLWDRTLACYGNACFSSSLRLGATLGAKRIRNAAPRHLGNGGADSVGDLIIVDLSRYQAEDQIAMQEIQQKFNIRFRRNFPAIFCCLKRERTKSLTSRKKDFAQ